MRKEDLQRVIELGEKATRGPWDADSEGISRSPWMGLTRAKVLLTPASDAWGEDGEENQMLIAHYRTAAPEMARMLLEIHEAFDMAHKEMKAGVNNRRADVATNYMIKIERILGR